MKKSHLFILFIFISNIVFSAVNLQITNINPGASTTLVRGNTYTVSVSVKNVGTTNTSTSFYTNLSLNSTWTYNGAQTWLADLFVSGGINAGATKTVSTTITIPCSYSSGSKYFLAGADATSVINESNESDNNASLPITITAPDLTPLIYSLSSSPYVAGQPLTTTFAVNNNGSVSVGSHSVGFYLSTSTTLSTSSAIYLGSSSVSSVPANGNTISFNKTLTLPCGLAPATYYLFIFIDEYNSVCESVENNNFQYQTIWVNNPPYGTTPSIISPGNSNSTSPPTTTLNTLSWNGISGVTNYRINITNQNTGVSTNFCTSGVTSYNLSSYLVSGNTYSWNIHAITVCSNPCLSNVSNNLYFTYTPCTPTTSVSLSSSSQTVCAGANTIITANPNGTGPYTYQWKRNGTPLSNSSTYSGVNTATLSISNTPSTAAGNYSCTINGCNNSSTTSGNCILSVTANALPNPYFYATTNSNINAGQSITFSPASGSTCSGCSYYWTFTGGNISSSTSQNPTVTYNTAGTYSVSFKITNSCGSTYTNYQSGFVTVQATSNPISQVKPKNNFINNKKHPHKTIADPVKIPTCDYGYDKSLLSMNTLAGIIDFKVFYNSNNPSYNSNLGLGWTHNYDFRIKNEGDTIWNVHYGSGYDVPFIKIFNENGISFPLYQGVFEKLYRNPTTGIFFLKFKNQTQYVFDSFGTLDFIIDRNNNITDLFYNVSGELVQIVGAGGRTWYLINSSGKITKITDAENHSINFGYNNGDIMTIRDADSNTTQFQYNGGHLMTKIILPLGNTLLENFYDSDGKVYLQYDGYGKLTYFYRNTPTTGFTKVVFSDSKYKIYQSDSSMRIIDEENELGNHIKHIYYANNIDSVIIDENNIPTYISQDSNGNITEIRKPLGVTHKYEFNATNDVIKEILPEGQTIQHILDAQGNEIQTVLQDTTNIWRTFAWNGLLKTVKNQLNQIDSFGYTAYGDINYTKSPTTGVTTQTHNNIGWVKTITNVLGHTAENFYNKRGHTVQFKDFDTKSVYSEFDANGNNTKVIDKKGYATRLLYDLKDRNYATINIYGDTVNKTSFADRDFVLSVKDANNNLTNFDLDGQGRTTKVTNPFGGQTISTLDGVGNVTMVKDVVNNITTNFSFDSLYRKTGTALGTITTSQVYNKNSWVTQSTNAQGKSHIFSHTPIGKVKNVLDPNQKNTLVNYNPLGSPKSVTDPNIHTTHTEYDFANRPSVFIDAIGNSDSVEYDALSRIKRTIKANGVIINKTYTTIGQISTVTFSTGEYMNYSYDDNGNILSVISQAGTQSYLYDSLNRVKKYTDVYGNVIEYGYDKVGNLILIKYGANKSLILEYNALNQVKKITDWNAKVWENIYNSSGRLIKRLYPNGMRCEYEYDIIGLVSKKSWIAKNNTTIYGDTITRIAWGDIANINCGKHYYKALKSSSYGANYNNADHIVSDSLGSHLYDKSGNDTNITKNSKTQSIGYTANNMLKSFTTTGLSYSNQFDAFFNRIQSTTNGKTTRFINTIGDGGLSYPLLEQNSNGVNTAYNIFSGGLLMRYDSSSKAIHYVTDLKHNVIALVDDSCVVTDRYTYSEQGKIGKHTGNTTQPFTWQGDGGVQAITDSVYYVRLRVYDASLTRFYGRDVYDYSLENPQTINRYVYSLNNSVNMHDWSGLCGESDDETYLSQAPTGFRKRINNNFNFFLGAQAGIADGLNFQFFNEERRGEVRATYSKAYYNGYNLFGLTTFAGNIALMFESGGMSEIGVAGGRMTTVGRWMSVAEYDAMKVGGQVLEGAGGKTSVSIGGYSSFPSATKGSVYAEFQVPTNSLVQGGRPDWYSIISPNAGKSQLFELQKQGGEFLPKIQNLSPILKIK